MSRTAELFGCTASEAHEEIEKVGIDTIQDIAWLRRVADVKALLDRSTDEDKLPDDKFLRMVATEYAELMKEELEAEQAAKAAAEEERRRQKREGVGR